MRACHSGVIGSGVAVGARYAFAAGNAPAPIDRNTDAKTSVGLFASLFVCAKNGDELGSGTRKALVIADEQAAFGDGRAVEIERPGDMALGPRDAVVRRRQPHIDEQRGGIRGVVAHVVVQHADRAVAAHGDGRQQRLHAGNGVDLRPAGSTWRRRPASAKTRCRRARPP